MLVAATPAKVAGDALNKSWKVIFNGDNYDEANQQMLTDRGVWRIDSGVEAIHQLSADKNKALFDEMSVMTPEECDARADILHDHYTGTVEMEALTLIDMINQHIIPSVKEAEVDGQADLEKAVVTLKAAVKEIHAAETSYEKAQLSRVLRLETMIDIRETCDSIEEIVPADLWTLATYKELMFLDQTDEGGLKDF